MGDAELEKAKSEGTQVYRFSTAEILSALSLCLALYIFSSDRGRQTSGDIGAAKEEIRAEYKYADTQLRAEIERSEARSAKALGDAETRIASGIRGSEIRDTKRFETLEAQVLNLFAKKR